MSFFSSIRDTWLVAQFELVRAIRTWRAVAMGVLFIIASAGGTWIFIEIIGGLENTVAENLGVPTTETPGTMLDKLTESKEFRRMIGGMVGDKELVDSVLKVPVLAVFNLWLGLLLMPFLCATSSAESIAIDVQSRALRYEALRTGRLEIVMGRFIGQTILVGVAATLGLVVVWIIGLTAMVGNTPLALAGGLAWFTVRSWFFGVAFIGIGVCASQLTASPAWSRVIALAATAGTWILYGIASMGRNKEGFLRDNELDLLWDVIIVLLPQGWMGGLWLPGIEWMAPAIACLGIGVVALLPGFVRFGRRDL